MKVEICSIDIEYGKMCDCERCPVALGMKRATGEEWIVGDDWMMSVDGKIRIETPAMVGRWIDDYDAGEPVEPFSFNLPESEPKL